MRALSSPLCALPWLLRKPWGFWPARMSFFPPFHQLLSPGLQEMHSLWSAPCFQSLGIWNFRKIRNIRNTKDYGHLCCQAGERANRA